MTTKPLPTLSVNDNVVLRLEDGSTQSAMLTHFSVKGDGHRYAHFAWKTGSARCATAAAEYLTKHGKP